MRRLTTLFSMLLLAVMSVWAEQVVLSTPSESVATLSDANGIITITDGSGNTGIQKGSSSYKLTPKGGEAVIPMKLSGSRQFNLTYADGVIVNKVTIYATSNGDDTGTLGVSKDDRESLGTLPVRGSETPLVADITNVTGLNASRQFLAIIVVDYSVTTPSLKVAPEALSFSLSPIAQSKKETFTLTARNLKDGTYNLTVPTVDGLSVEPTSFKVASGSCDQEFTVTYASTADVAKAEATITATVGELTASVAVSYQSRATAYTQSTISADAAWDWSKLSETVELTAETTPTKSEEFLLADLDDRINFTEDFGDAKAIKMEGMQFPSRSGFAQGSTIKFTTDVPGTVAVDFCNTGGSRPYRYLTVNGTTTEFKSNSTEKVSATGIAVPAGEVVISIILDPDAATNFEGYDESKHGVAGATTMARYYKVAFTADATDATFDFKNNNGNWTYGEGSEYEKGTLTTITNGNVSLTGIQGTAYNPARIMKNDSKGIHLQVFKGNALKLAAPEGKAIVSVNVTMQAKTFDFTPNCGALADNTWTGNATSVTFYNETGSRYIYVISVDLADKTAETEDPDAAVEVADIAAFNALDKYKVGKLTLKDAVVTAYWDLPACYYVQDATGAVAIQGVTLTKGTKLNGTITGTKGNDTSVDSEGNFVAYSLTASDISDITATETTLEGTVMTAAEAMKQANYGKLITLENVTISGDGQNKTLTDADGNELAIKARDYMGVLSAEYVWPEKASKITGVLVYYVTGWFLMPISEEAIVAAGAESTEVTFNFADSNFRKDIGTKLTDVKGNIYNETFTVDNVSFQVTAGSAATKLYVDANRGQNLVTYKEYTTLTFRAPANYAITQITFTAAGNSNIDKLTASSGAIEGMTWTGNAEGVRFAQGGTSYLANAVVTLAAKTAETAALPDIEYTECANIAAFNALKTGTYAKVTLTDAEVTGISADGYSTVWIQDATGGCWLQYTSLNTTLTEKTKVNGTVYVVARVNSGNVQMKEAEGTPNSELTATAIDELTIAATGSISEVNVDANKNRVVTITGSVLSLTAAGKTAGTLTDGDATLAINNGNETANQQLHKLVSLDDFMDKQVTVTGILVAKSATENQILPISIASTPTGINDINAEVNAENVEIYNLQGVRMNKLQKGLNIVNGRKVVMK